MRTLRPPKVQWLHHSHISSKCQIPGSIGKEKNQCFFSPYLLGNSHINTGSVTNEQILSEIELSQSDLSQQALIFHRQRKQNVKLPSQPEGLRETEAVQSGHRFSYGEHKLAYQKIHVLHEYGHIRMVIYLHWRAGNPIGPQTLQILTDRGEQCGFGLIFVQRLSGERFTKDLGSQQSKLR